MKIGIHFWTTYHKLVRNSKTSIDLEEIDFSEVRERITEDIRTNALSDQVLFHTAIIKV